MVNIVTRGFALLFYISRIVYWWVTEGKANTEKPRQARKTWRNRISRISTDVVDVVILLQLAGLSILPISGNILLLQWIGLVLVVAGTRICIVARKQIGANWVHGAEYQIKKKQELVTTGIYAYIRHPIYAGVFLMYIGSELVSGSYLVISFLAFFFIFSVQAKREEKILLAHFGEQYRGYMKKTKMLIPFVF
jgi:protein-S-isoprenylcysteine O-methyltransferase Ste14